MLLSSQHLFTNKNIWNNKILLFPRGTRSLKARDTSCNHNNSKTQLINPSQLFKTARTKKSGIYLSHSNHGWRIRRSAPQSQARRTSTRKLMPNLLERVLLYTGWERDHRACSSFIMWPLHGFWVHPSLAYLRVEARHLSDVSPCSFPGRGSSTDGLLLPTLSNWWRSSSDSDLDGHHGSYSTDRGRRNPWEYCARAEDDRLACRSAGESAFSRAGEVIVNRSDPTVNQHVQGQERP